MESESTPMTFRFIDPTPEQFSNPHLNVHLQEYWKAGAPVLRSKEAQQASQDWSRVFGREAPLNLEIGPGNGFFLAGMAEFYPEEDWLGLEIRYKRVMLCAKKIQSKALSNALITRYDAWLVGELFPQDSLSGLYTNHPDPWQKKRQAKKRLLNEQFCIWAASALKSGCSWRIKTDFEQHILTVLEHCRDLPFAVTGRENDVESNGAPWEKDIETNYQSKFREKGLPVYALELTRN